MNLGKILKEIPTSVHILVFPREERSKSVGETLENLKSRYRSGYMVKDVLRIELESFDAHIEGVEEEE
ncbi:MAG: hypothetical protein DRN90_05285, partial [Thermoproteota archaeon]